MSEGNYLNVTTSDLSKSSYTSNTVISLRETNSLRWLIRLREGDGAISHHSSYSGSLKAYLLDEEGNITGTVSGSTGYNTTINVSGAVYVFLSYTSGTRGDITITVKPAS